MNITKINTMQNSITFCIVFLTMAACNSPKDTDKTINLTTVKSEVEKAIDKSVAGAYDFWKFEKDIASDFSNYNSFYTPNAILQTIKGDSIKKSFVKDGLEEFKKAIGTGQITYFKEYEIASKTEYYGNIAHRISYHVYFINSRDSISKRAVNSLQIVNINGKWLLNSILRRFEDNDFPFPSEYNDIEK